MLEDASISAACFAIWNCSLLANAPRTDSCCPCSCKVRDSVVVVFTLLVFYWLAIDNRPGFGCRRPRPTHCFLIP
nr:MAG TPA_asm: hypothetical protein [Caudoviricetes sp.]